MGMNQTKNQRMYDERCIADTNITGYVGNKFFENRIEREWLSTEEAAHYLRLSENALRIMVCRGQIPVGRFGRRLRFSVRDCRALIHKGGV